MRSVSQDDADLDYQINQAVLAGDIQAVHEWASRISSGQDASLRITRVFLGTADEAPDQSLRVLLETEQVDLHEIDDINHRNILHKAAISGRQILLKIGLQGNVDVRAIDVYGRIPLHYACMHGSDDLIQSLYTASPDTLEFKDLDKFTPLIHAITHERREVVRRLLSLHARVDPDTEQDHIPLNLACQHGSSTVVEEILKHNPQILPDAEGLYPQHLVARSPKAPQLLLMLKNYGADLDQPDKLYQWTPLFHAASEGNVECLRTLIECNVDCRILDEKGLSAIYYAAWEGHISCIQMLIDANCVPSPRVSAPLALSSPPKVSLAVPPTTPGLSSRNEDNIPPLVLPPAIVPIRRYGHNFLEEKTFVVLNFGTFGQDAIQFYDDNKYPAARITVSSKSSDLIPRNLLLPIQDDSKVLSFQIDNLETFSIEFDVYATFGARVIARAVASSKVFTNQAGSSGTWHLELLDPRLRAIGRISFSFLVVKPFTGIPLEISHFATYWKATAHDLQAQATPLITGSSLSGDYVRLFVQLTYDKIPVLYPLWSVNHHGLEVPVMRLTWDQFSAVGAEHPQRHEAEATLATFTRDPDSAVNPKNIAVLHRLLATSFDSLADVLAVLPPQVNVELHVLYPNAKQEEDEKLGPSPSINDFADAMLKVVFEHARETRGAAQPYLRGITFSSYNAEICTALNWKQPNCERYYLY
jgi:CDK inhibitor PHO81